MSIVDPKHIRWSEWPDEEPSPWRWSRKFLSTTAKYASSMTRHKLTTSTLDVSKHVYGPEVNALVQMARSRAEPLEMVKEMSSQSCKVCLLHDEAQVHNIHIRCVEAFLRTRRICVGPIHNMTECVYSRVAHSLPEMSPKFLGDSHIVGLK